MTLKEKVSPEGLVPEHERIPVLIIHPHLLIWNFLLLEPLGSHLLSLHHVAGELLGLEHMDLHVDWISHELEINDGAGGQVAGGDAQAALLAQLPCSCFGNGFPLLYFPSKAIPFSFAKLPGETHKPHSSLNSLAAASGMVSPFSTFPPKPFHFPLPKPLFFIPSNTSPCLRRNTRVKCFFA